MARKIFFSNIGYARGIDGTLWQHIAGAHRHLYCTIPAQQQVLMQLKSIIDKEQPDICCLVEIDSGSIHSGYYNQIEYLKDDHYAHYDIADKYGDNSLLGEMPLFRGKCNAFLSKQETPFQRLYFKHGSKRLIYSMELPDNIRLFFAHFSLQRAVRAKQFDELRNIVKTHGGESIVLADFNIMQGFSELDPLVQGTDLRILNTEDAYTFTFHKMKKVLDLCLCSESLIPKIRLNVIPQPFSDHAALLVELSGT